MEAKYHFPEGISPQGPYTPVVEHNGLLYISGQGTFQPETGKKFLEDDIAKQTQIAMTNLAAAAKAAGATLNKTLKVTIFTTRLSETAKINEVYQSFFPNQKPARSTIGVAELPGGMLIEIEAIVAL